ncbi:MAG: AbrB/MazE/SpoVT family DNA-binding domain-containing protein [Nanoarchaeota archaeon]
MKRKVIQLAGKTLVVSLPSKWAKAANVKKGDEVEIEEKGRDLLLKTSGEAEEMKITLDAKGMSEQVFRWCISSLHKQGYDEIEITYNKKEYQEWTNDLVKNLLLGFVITSHNPNRIIVRRISQDMESEFETSLRRAFYVTINLGEELVTLLKKKQYNQIIDLLPLEKTNNQLTNFCERLLNKKGHPRAKKTCFYYCIVWNIEKICDEYRDICRFFAKHEHAKYSKELINMIESSVLFLKEYVKVLYDFNMENLDDLHKERREFMTRVEAAFVKKGVEEQIILGKIMGIVGKIDDFSASTISIHLKNTATMH